jgi:hypothetical protein
LKLFLSGIAMGPDRQEPGSQPAATTKTPAEISSDTSAETPAQPSAQSPVEPLVEPVSSEELNAWRRGFTPQAEIWNGRLAMLGLAVGLTVLLIARISHHS